MSRQTSPFLTDFLPPKPILEDYAAADKVVKATGGNCVHKRKEVPPWRRIVRWNSGIRHQSILPGGKSASTSNLILLERVSKSSKESKSGMWYKSWTEEWVYQLCRNGQHESESGRWVGRLDHHRRSLKSLRGCTPVLSRAPFDKQVTLIDSQLPSVTIGDHL